MRRRIDVYVDELRIAEGQGSPEVMVAAIEAELRRLLMERGLPGTSGGHVERVVSPYRDDGSAPGVATARAVYEGIRSNATVGN